MKFINFVMCVQSKGNNPSTAQDVEQALGTKTEAQSGCNDQPFDQTTAKRISDPTGSLQRPAAILRLTSSPYKSSSQQT
jgi:hypothetical protein